jgi:hypothetical protein
VLIHLKSSQVVVVVKMVNLLMEEYAAIALKVVLFAIVKMFVQHAMKMMGMYLKMDNVRRVE